MKRILTLTGLAVVLAASAARAQAPSTSTSAMVNDQLFAEAAGFSGLAEVALSEIGVQRARDPELKSFSQKMIDDHHKLNQELTSLAARKRYALPRTLDIRTQFCTQNLKGVSSETFDECYAKAQLIAHMEAVAAFQAESERGNDPEMKALASKALPQLKDHLHTIIPIAKRFEKEHKEAFEKAGK